MNKLNSQRIVAAAIFCGIAGFIGFLIQEPHIRAYEIDTASAGLESAFVSSILAFGLLGLLIGIGLIIADEFGSTSGRRIFIRVMIGAVAGAVCGAGGGLIGQGIYSILLNSDNLNLASLIAARTIGWAAVGAGTGLSSGLAVKNKQKAMKGVIGGAIGGAIGGILFDLMSIPFGGGTVSRMIGDTAIGVFVGVFVIAIEEMSKTAWITVVAGKNEGKQYILSKPSTTIGRNELSDIPLFGDQSVAKNHAVIQTMDGQQYLYVDSGSATGTAFNNVRVSQKVCTDGDRLQIGRFMLIFRLQATAKTPVTTYTPNPLTRQPIQYSSICPFCGGVCNPDTGQCLCSPVGAVSPRVIAPPNLCVMSGPYNGRSFPINGLQISIGRDSSNSIVMDQDGGVSRQHVFISCENSIYYVRDNNSSNGTYVNGHRVNQTALNHGDIIHIGGSDLSFRVT